MIDPKAVAAMTVRPPNPKVDRTRLPPPMSRWEAAKSHLKTKNFWIGLLTMTLMSQIVMFNHDNVFPRISVRSHSIPDHTLLLADIHYSFSTQQYQEYLMALPPRPLSKELSPFCRVMAFPVRLTSLSSRRTRIGALVKLV